MWADIKHAFVLHLIAMNKAVSSNTYFINDMEGGGAIVIITVGLVRDIYDTAIRLIVDITEDGDCVVINWGFLNGRKLLSSVNLHKYH